MIRRLVVTAIFLLLVAPGLAQAQAAPQLPYLSRGRRLAGARHTAAAQRQADRNEPGLRERPLWRAAPQASAPAAGEARMLRRDDDDHAARRRAVLLYRWQSAPAGHQFHPESQGRAHHDLDRRRQHPALHQHRRRHRPEVPGCRRERDPKRSAADRRGAPPRRGTGSADCRREFLRPVPRGMGAAATAAGPDAGAGLAGDHSRPQHPARRHLHRVRRESGRCGGRLPHRRLARSCPSSTSRGTPSSR